LFADPTRANPSSLLAGLEASELAAEVFSDAAPECPGGGGMHACSSPGIFAATHRWSSLSSNSTAWFWKNCA
jgi:hypothetical protein